MTSRVRPYGPDDRAACAGVFFRAVRESAAGAYTDAQRAAWAPGPEPDWLQDDRLLPQWCVVAERDGHIAGFMSMYPYGYLDMAFVLPEEMGRGTAGLLYDALLGRARAAGLPRLTVHASVCARAFLARRGWQVDSTEEVERHGQHFVRSCMSLTITPTNGPSMTTIRRWNPDTMPRPASRYSQAALATGVTAWLHLSGQVGNRADGSTVAGLQGQLEQCLANVDAGLAAAGMGRGDVVKLTFYLTDGSADAIAIYRAARDAWVGAGDPPACTLLIVAGLAGPGWLAEVDCVAAS
jgi:enamine deaminase RidA (YjgF/YER057c/UK114 family)/GNAT superfamily N-acetyltransferase